MKDTDIVIRRANEREVVEITQLFSDTIQTINRRDYNQNQLDVWSSSSVNSEIWQNKIAEQYFIVALNDMQIVGFSSFEENGYLDFMFVHKDYQRKGIAKRLLEDIESKAKEQSCESIFSDVSITARPFFESRGYEVVKQVLRVKENESFISFRMCKLL